MKPMTMPRTTAITLALAALAVTGCGKDKKAQPAGVVSGEVAPGTISDAMIPLDTVRSQAPLAPRAEASGGQGASSGKVKSQAGSDAPAAPSGEAATEADAEPATPAAE